LCQSRAKAVSLPHIGQDRRLGTDKLIVRQLATIADTNRFPIIPWAIQMQGISVEEPGRLVQTLTGAILGCGGWILSRGASDAGSVSLLFEFERHCCVEIYTILVAAGVELSRNDHLRFTELCQCTRLQAPGCGLEIASVELDIQTFPAEFSREMGPAQIEQ
jgi:hypothetical protein